MRVIPTRFAGALAAFFAMVSTPLVAQDKDAGWSLAIHGGAGTIARENMTPEQDAAYRAALQRALDAGAAVLRDGGSAMEAIQAAIEPMEDDALFNAGRGAVLTWDGDIELDASIMDGRTRDAGAVAGVTGIRHPIELARLVMTDSPHVMLAGKGAETFAEERGLERMPREWFETERRKEALERLKAERLSALDVDIKFGTVGAVARDSKGNLAAGTSTGGMTGKRWGRVGDAPVIGAGTYADNRACGISATGHGEYFIRAAVAHDICARVLYGNRDLQTAADEVIQQQLVAMGAEGGVIGLAPDGTVVYSFNTAGMYRAAISSAGELSVGIYGESESMVSK